MGHLPADEHNDPLDAYAIVPVAAVSIVIVVALIPMLSGGVPYGTDAASHITLIGTLTDRLQTGTGWWEHAYNGGFPLGLYYQPLPHVLTALLAWALGGPEEATMAFNLMVIAALAAQPWAIFVGARRAGADASTAAAAACIAPMVISGFEFGVGPATALQWGLFTQAWGHVALPLALGELAAVARGEGNAALAGLTGAACAVTHAFFAVALIPLAFLLVLAHTARRTYTHFLMSRERGRQLWTDAARFLAGVCARLAAAAAAGLALVAGWLLPLWHTRAFMGGWPFSSADRADGIGFGEVIMIILDGRALDGANAASAGFAHGVQPFAAVGDAPSAIPVLSFLAIMGLLLIARRALSEPYSATVFAFTACGLFGTVGRGGLGPIPDFIPFHAGIELFRYGALLELALVLCAGIALDTLMRRAARLAPVGVAALLGAALLALPASRALDQLAVHRAPLDEGMGLDERISYAELLEWLTLRSDQGRHFIGPRSGLRGPRHGALLAHLADRPAAQSYGAGMHDAHLFYMMETIDPRVPGADQLLDLFDIRLLIAAPGTPLHLPAGSVKMAANGVYELHQLTGERQSATVMRDVGEVAGNPRELREDIRRWLAGNGPEDRLTYRIVVADPRSGADTLRAPLRVDGQTRIDAAPPRGEVLFSYVERDSMQALVHLDEPALVVFKTAYHPYWSVEISHRPAETLMVYPGFLAVAAPAGESRVEATFAWPSWARWLWPLGALALLLVGVLDNVRARFSSRLNGGASSPDGMPSGRRPRTDAPSDARFDWMNQGHQAAAFAIPEAVPNPAPDTDPDPAPDPAPDLAPDLDP